MDQRSKFFDLSSCLHRIDHNNEPESDKVEGMTKPIQIRKYSILQMPHNLHNISTLEINSMAETKQLEQIPKSLLVLF